ncbi:MAG: DUF1836 domain-containing protein [Anaerofustis sp.]|jgi:DNA-binding transcriptional MerR regulator
MRVSKLPGTTVDTDLSPGIADQILTPMFYSGGLVLSQISQLTGLEGHVIQNWVKRGYLSPPVQKKYTRSQLCRILNINVLKDIFTLDQTAHVLGYINGVLADDSDDIIDDSDLYSYFVDCLAALQENGSEEPDDVVSEITASFCGEVEDGAKRLCEVLRIMITAYRAHRIRQQALELYAELDYR